MKVIIHSPGPLGWLFGEKDKSIKIPDSEISHIVYDDDSY